MKTRFIADIGSNHNQDYNRAIKLIDTAKVAGCWGVKFQLFDAEKLYAPGYGDVEELKKREFPIDWIPKLSEYCKSIDIKFGCTPFYLEAVNILKDHVDFFKISSFDIQRLDLILTCARAHKELMISTGLAEDMDITNVISYIYDTTASCRIVLFHCVSNYPTQSKETRLSHIIRYTEQYKINDMCLRAHEITDIGWSDHTACPEVLFAAWKAGASVVEFHLDICEFSSGVDYVTVGREHLSGHCWEFSAIKNVISTIHAAENILKSDLFVKIDYDQAADPTDGLRPMKQARK